MHALFLNRKLEICLRFPGLLDVEANFQRTVWFGLVEISEFI